MPHPATNLTRFLSRLRRRMVLLRVLERAGVGAAVACGLGLALLPVLASRDVPSLPTVLGLLAAGAMLGGLTAFARRQDATTAATLADEQLELHDLLSTAWSVRESGEAWAATVVALADARCATLTPREVVLVRVGVRGWSAIAGTVAVTLSVTAVVSTSRTTLATARDDASGFVAVDDLRDPPPPPAARLPVRHPPADRPDAAATGEPDALMSPSPAAADGTTAADADSTTSNTGASRGEGVGESRSPEAAERPASGSPASPVATPDADARAGRGARATGRGDGFAVSGSAVTAGTTTGAAASHVPPWSASTWPVAREAALQAVNDGSIPDPYRDLVRGYFEEPSSR